MVYHAPLFIDPHYDGIQIQNNNSFLFRINNYLPCQDLNPGPTGMKQIAYQCATMIRWLMIYIQFWFSYPFRVFVGQEALEAVTV